MKIHNVKQNTLEWGALRASKPTASNFSMLVTTKGVLSKSMEKYAVTLAEEMFAGKPLDSWNGNKFTDYGHEIEDQARSAYELRTGQDVEKVGFVTDDLEQWGCSPDGLVGDDGMVEIKCLPKEHTPTLLKYKETGKTPSDKIVQPQGQMMICERKWCDLVFYRPSLPMLIIRQFPDPVIVNGLKVQLKAVIAQRNIVHNILKEF